MPAVATAHGINANWLRLWIDERAQSAVGAVAEAYRLHRAADASATRPAGAVCLADPHRGPLRCDHHHADKARKRHRRTCGMYVRVAALILIEAV